MDDALASSLFDAASEMLRLERVPEAIEAHRRLLRYCPDLADSWYNLGYLLQRSRDFEAALAAYRRALDLGVGDPHEVRLNIAVVLADHLARPTEATKELQAALAIAPRYLPALINLGNLHEQAGDRERATHAYESALSIDPDHPLALARLPDLKKLVRHDDSLIRRLRGALANPNRDAAERADLGFGLGKALDRVGAYDEAFDVYSAANQASRESAGPMTRYDRSAHQRFVDHLIEGFPAPVVTVDDVADARKPPIFICGMFRSGSTLVEQILASHPRVTAGGEIDMLPVIANRLLAAQGGQLVSLGGETVHHARQAYLEGLGRLFPKADLVTDKRPDNFLLIGMIRELFPAARIIHTQREPIDNCLSVFFLHLSHAMPYATDLVDIAHWYGQYRRLMTHWKRLYPDAIVDVNYDELVASPRSVIRSLLETCNLEWDEACLQFHRTSTIVRTPSAWQVRQPIYTRSSGRWRHYERHLGPLREALSRVA